MATVQLTRSRVRDPSPVGTGAGHGERCRMNRRVLIVLALLLAGCRQPTTPGPSPTGPATPATPAATGMLENTSYHLNEIGSFRLENGRYQDEGGEENRLTARLLTSAQGDLNQDGTEDGVVVLETTIGEGPPVRHLAAVVVENGEPTNQDSLYLGEKVDVADLAIEPDGLIRFSVKDAAQSYVMDRGHLTEVIVVSEGQG